MRFHNRRHTAKRVGVFNRRPAKFHNGWFHSILECAGRAKRDGAFGFRLRTSRTRRKAPSPLRSATHSINKKASRKAYDWPLKLEKLLRHKTSGAQGRSSPPSFSL